MKNIMMIAALLTAGCTIAVNDPEKFDRIAARGSKVYAVPRDDLWSCFLRFMPPSGADITYQTEKEFVYKTSGIALIKFQKAKTGTLVMAEVAPNGWDTPQRYLSVTDKCSHKGRT